MQAPDVNVLVYAHRPESPEHDAYRRWLEALVSNDQPFALSELVLSGFLRIVTHAKIFKAPTPLRVARELVDQLVQRTNCVLLRPGPRHLAIFLKLCDAANVAGPLVADAYHAALAIEHGCEWVTTDGDFARFAGLRSIHPLRS